MVDVNSHTRRTLTLLLQAGGATTTQLTRLLGRRHPQSTSATLKLLNARGWVVKDVDMWRVTNEGREALGPHEVRYVPAHDRGGPSSSAAILEALAGEAMTTSEVARATGLERSNTHKRLEKLAAKGRVERVPGRPVMWRKADSS